MLRSNQLLYILWLNSLYTLVLYNLYFLSPQFHFLANLVPVVYEKTEMVLSSDSRQNLTSSHVILQMSACMRDTCPRDTLQR
jgi:hypothetical protein